jgi:hypothetical protein
MFWCRIRTTRFAKDSSIVTLPARNGSFSATEIDEIWASLADAV